MVVMVHETMTTVIYLRNASLQIIHRTLPHVKMHENAHPLNAAQTERVGFVTRCGGETKPRRTCLLSHRPYRLSSVIPIRLDEEVGV